MHNGKLVATSHVMALLSRTLCCYTPSYISRLAEWAYLLFATLSMQIAVPARQMYEQRSEDQRRTLRLLITPTTLVSSLLLPEPVLKADPHTLAQSVYIS
jgi:hypothetical protein